MGVDVSAITERYERALQVVHELCHEGRQWILSLPADEANDPDVILRASLRDIHAMVIETTKLRSVAAAAERLTEASPLNVNEFKNRMEHLRGTLHALKET